MIGRGEAGRGVETAAVENCSGHHTCNYRFLIVFGGANGEKRNIVLFWVSIPLENKLGLLPVRPAIKERETTTTVTPCAFFVLKSLMRREHIYFFTGRSRHIACISKRDFLGFPFCSLQDKECVCERERLEKSFVFVEQ